MTASFPRDILPPLLASAAKHMEIELPPPFQKSKPVTGGAPANHCGGIAHDAGDGDSGWAVPEHRPYATQKPVVGGGAPRYREFSALQRGGHASERGRRRLRIRAAAARGVGIRRTPGRATSPRQKGEARRKSRLTLVEVGGAHRERGRLPHQPLRLRHGGAAEGGEIGVTDAIKPPKIVLRP